MSDMLTRFKRHRTLAVSRARKLKRSGSCRASAPLPCSARLRLGQNPAWPSHASRRMSKTQHDSSPTLVSPSRLETPPRARTR